MPQASFRKYQLHFKFDASTSRGKMKVKNGYYLFVSDGASTGTGECSFIEGLSIDEMETYEATLQLVCNHFCTGSPLPDLSKHPSIKFGYEMALCDLESGGKKILFPGDFTNGKAQIPINGLIWMGSRDFMLQQIRQKLDGGFKCVKIKVGGINFEEETGLLSFIRQQYMAEVLELRVDANGAFNQHDVFKKLEALAKFNIHSIEQPVKQGQLDLMKKVCAQSPVPVALDEELIDIKGISKRELLQYLSPHYIILKPSLLGGFDTCNEWIQLAAEQKTAWWATSALESNIGLNAIAQWVFTKNKNMVQGLGTGGLYTNNVSSPLFINHGYLGYNPATVWGDI